MRVWMRACERVCVSARASIRACACPCVRPCVRASVRPWVSSRPSAHARIGRRLSLSESPFRVVCRIAYQSRCEDLSESLSHPSRCLVQYPSRRPADDRSESPIRLVNPSRQSESPIRIATRVQLQENVRKGREKGRELLMSVYAGVGTAVRCKYAYQV